MTSIKQQLYIKCISYAQERLDRAQYGIDEARASSANETKSSAGDKYETGRAMAQQEIDRNTALLAEARQLLNTLNRINVDDNSIIIIPGSLVITDEANFYIAISAGTITIDNEKYFGISAATPIGLKMMGKKVGDGFEMNGIRYQIKEIH